MLKIKAINQQNKQNLKNITKYLVNPKKSRNFAPAFES